MRILGLLLLVPALALGQVVTPAISSTSPLTPPAINVTGDQSQSNVPLTTTGPLTLYVDPTGSDANACTASGTGACLTIQAAVNKIPKRVRHPVTVNVATGNYSGATLQGFSFDLAADSTKGSWLLLQGSYPLASVLTGTASGTLTSATAGSTDTFGTATDLAQAWTVNDLTGRLMEITGGSRAGRRFLIVSNTATSLTIAGNFGTAPNNTSQYNIEDVGANCNQATTTAISLRGPADTGSTAGVIIAPIAGVANDGACINILGNSGASGQPALSNPPIAVEGVKCTPSLGRCVQVANNTVPVSLRWLKTRTAALATRAEVETTRNTAPVMITNSFFPSCGISGCVGVDSEVAATGFGFEASTSGAGALYIDRSLFQFPGGTSAQGIDTSVQGQASKGPTVQIQECQFSAPDTSGRFIYVSGQATTVNVQSSRFSGGQSAIWMDNHGADSINPVHVVINTSDISGAVTAITSFGREMFSLSVVTGTGNTTVLQLNNGAVGQISSDSTITGTTEISMDGDVFTFADMRAQTGKSITSLLTGSRVFQ